MLLGIVGSLEKGRPQNTEGEKEPHREAEEDGRGEDVGDRHSVDIKGSTFLKSCLYIFIIYFLLHLSKRLTK